MIYRAACCPTATWLADSRLVEVPKRRGVHLHLGFHGTQYGWFWYVMLPERYVTSVHEIKYQPRFCAYI